MLICLVSVLIARHGKIVQSIQFNMNSSLKGITFKPLRFILLLLTVFAFVYKSYAEEHDILVIHSYHQGLEWTDSISSGILSVFKDHPEYNIYFEYMDTKRNTSDDYYHSFVNLYRSRTSKIQYDAIIVSDNAAYNFMLDYKDEFFPETPVFFCGVNFLDQTELFKHKNIYGFEEVSDHAGTIELIRRLFPERKKVLIINDYSLTGRQIRNQLDEVIPKYSDELQFEIIDTFSIDELKTKVASLNSDYAIYQLITDKDRFGNYISQYGGIHLTLDNTSAPVFCSSDPFLGQGIVGGCLTRGFEQGIDVASLTWNYLNGQNPSPKQYQKGSSTPLVDYKVLTNFGIPINSLDEDIKVINTPPQKTDWLILWLEYSIVVLIILLIVLFGFNHYRKIRARKLVKLVDLRTQELTKANNQLEKTNQSKNEILGVVAHDLRNPIGNITGFSELILEEDDNAHILNHRSRKSLEYIHDLSTYMLRLVNNLLDMSVIESGILKLDCNTSDYVAFIREETEVNRALAEQKKLALKFDCEAKSIKVIFDNYKIRQAFNNLISNAIKFSKEGDTIYITIKESENSVRTSIKDSGPGIPENRLNEIFVKYSQIGTDKSIKSKGTGLGLSIAKGIIEAHQGSIRVKSVLGEGSEFIYELPISG